MRRKILWLTFWVTVTLWLGQGVGCHQLNETNRLRHTDPLPALAADPKPLRFDGQPSLDGIDRSHWPTTTIRLTRHDAQTRPPYWQSILLSRDHPVLTGAYPTPRTALDLRDQPQVVVGQYGEAVIDPPMQMLNLFIFPGRLAMTVPFQRIWYGPGRSYDMLPEATPVEGFSHESDSFTARE